MYIRLMTMTAAAILAAGSASGGEPVPTPVNPFQGTQEREEVYEFAERLKVEKKDDGWIISFTSKANCDATVSILDKDGDVIRHLASGVLGKNAPYPLQQNSLSQKIAWDGLTDTFEKAPAGCTARVSLGLRAAFERNIAWDPCEASQPPDHNGNSCELGVGADGARHVFMRPPGVVGVWNYKKEKHVDVKAFMCGAVPAGRTYDKDGNYVRTFWPPAAKDLEKAVDYGFKLATTKWGDKVPFAPGRDPGLAGVRRISSMRDREVRGLYKELGVEPTDAPFPADIVEKHNGYANTIERFPFLYGMHSHAAVDPVTDDLYVGSITFWCRFDGKTGEPRPVTSIKTHASDISVGPDGLAYLRCSPYVRYVCRIDRKDTLVPFTVNAMPKRESLPENLRDKGDAKRVPEGYLITGSLTDGGGAQEHGIDVNEQGHMVLVISEKGLKAPDATNPKHLKACLTPYEWAAREARDLGLKLWKGATAVDGRVGVWNTDGTCLTTNAVEGRRPGAGVWMDRDGSIYMVQGGLRLPGWTRHDGIADREGGWYGISSIVKFRGLGGSYPVGTLRRIAEGAEAPEGALVMADGHVAIGGLWAFPMGGSPPKGCQCPQWRPQMDGYSRMWIPANQLCSVTVIDTNGNRVARIGRYGNVEDADPDVGKIHFCWLRSVAASDRTMYAVDSGNRRILKAALSYYAEEEVALK